MNVDGVNKLVREAQSGSTAAQDDLLHRFKNLVKARASAYYIAGGDRDDLVQEGMIGLFKAIRDFDCAKGGPFAAFADLCVLRQIRSAVKASSRMKHQPLNMSLSLSAPGDGGYAPANRAKDPESMVIDREMFTDIDASLKANLSPLEYEVFWQQANGASRADIAQTTSLSLKSIDNALYRVRKKIKQILIVT